MEQECSLCNGVGTYVDADIGTRECPACDGVGRVLSGEEQEHDTDEFETNN